MSVRTILVALFAIIFGTSAAVGVNILRHSWTPKNLETIDVVVASYEIPRFTTLSAEHLKVREYPRELVPAGSFSKIEDVVDRVADATFASNEPLIEVQVSAKGAGRGAAAVIPPGMRAMTIKTPNAEAGVAGFILPGNRVDVLLTLRGVNDDDSGGGSTTTLLQNVEILAVDQKVEAPSDNKVNLKELRSVTLLVTPFQAAKLDLGQNHGTLHLSLRNPLDSKAETVGHATLRELRGRSASWKELASAGKELLAALNRPSPKSKAKAEPVTQAAPLPPLMIRTLRGTYGGLVPLE